LDLDIRSSSADASDLEAFNVVEHVSLGLVARPIRFSVLWRSVFSEEKKLSIAALSQALPERSSSRRHRDLTSTSGTARWCIGRIQAVVATKSLLADRSNWSRAFAGVFPNQASFGPGVESGSHGRNLLGAVHAEIGAFWEVLA